MLYQVFVVCLFVCLMVFNATFSNILVISWRSVLLVEETGGPEKTTDLSHVNDKLYHIMLYTSPWSRFELTTSVMIGTDCIGSCKSNYHMTTTVPSLGTFIVKKFPCRIFPKNSCNCVFCVKCMSVNFNKLLHCNWMIGLFKYYLYALSAIYSHILTDPLLTVGLRMEASSVSFSSKLVIYISLSVTMQCKYLIDYAQRTIQLQMVPNWLFNSLQLTCSLIKIVYRLCYSLTYEVKIK